MEIWRFLESGESSAALNMAVDELLLLTVAGWKAPVLRFYGWDEPAASFGYFQKFADVEAMTPLRPLVRRPTGGGIVPHDRDWTYSVAFPPGHFWYDLKAIESYLRVHEWVCAAFQKLGVSAEVAPEAAKTGPGQCFLGHEKFDLLHKGRKIAGAAQRRTRSGLLIQGSIQPPSRSVDRDAWHRAMFDAMPGVRWVALDPLGIQAQALELAIAKYASESFLKMR